MSPNGTGNHFGVERCHAWRNHRLESFGDMHGPTTAAIAVSRIVTSRGRSGGGCHLPPQSDAQRSGNTKRRWKRGPKRNVILHLKLIVDRSCSTSAAGTLQSSCRGNNYGIGGMA
ncbi:hypothetical protein BS78_04G281800 [Paspalum vaginatum]|nr:hypothetical protein BS78_04G281800 [Paspalum vaginatum]